MINTKKHSPTDQSAHIHYQRFERDFNHNQTTVLSLELKNFVVELTNKPAEIKINKALEKQAGDFITKSITELYPQAVKDFITSSKNTYPFNPYTAMLSYVIPFNEKCHLSTYRDEYVFTGGAHGITTRLADTYNLATGATIPLSAYFKKDKDHRKLILTEILRQARELERKNPNTLFDDYETLIAQTFNEKSYYLTTNGLVIFFGQYDIAPYASGIRTFVIPYNMLDYPPNCNSDTASLQLNSRII